MEWNNQPGLLASVLASGTARFPQLLPDWELIVLIGPGGFRAPPLVAVARQLAIVKTYIFGPGGLCPRSIQPY